MQIDWITVLAQLVNFLILVWLLNRFLFKPVIKVMSERESLIEARLQDAAAASGEAQLAREEHQNATAELEARERSILEAAITRANEEQQRLLDAARQDIEQRRSNWLQNLEDEKRDSRNAFRHATASGTRLLTDSLLRKISNNSLNEQMISSFLDQLDLLDPSVITRLKSENNTVTLVSAIALDSASKRNLTRAIHEAIDHALAVEYQVDSELIAGVQLTANGVSLDWHLQSMLKDVDSRVLQALEAVDVSTY